MRLPRTSLVAPLSAALSAVPLAQSPLLGESHAMLPSALDETRSVVLGDVDGDGDLDAAVANTDGTPNRLYANDGTGAFLETTGDLPDGSGDTSALLFLDADADGDLDLFVGNEGVSQDRLFVGDGAGAFVDVPGLIPAFGEPTSSAAAGDVDLDGRIDLLVGIEFGFATRLYFGAGAGVFSDASGLLPSNSGPTGDVELFDVDGDGDLDVYLGEGSFLGSFVIGQQDMLFVNDGTGGFSDATFQLPADADPTASLATGDVDRDGDVDLLIGNGYGHEGFQNRLYLNDGSGVFVDSVANLPADMDETKAVALADVDGDGDLDAWIGNSTAQNRLYRNNGLGVFGDVTAAAVPAELESCWALAVGDVDGDVDVDVFIGNGYRGQNTLLLNSGAGAYTDVTSTLETITPGYNVDAAFADVDGDGDLDALVADYAGPDRLLLGDGTGLLEPSVGQLPVDSESTFSVALGDVDGDGSPDAILGSGAPFESTRLYLNDGAGTFFDGSAGLPGDGGPTHGAELADLDGDGDLDAVLAKGGSNRILRNGGGGVFTAANGALPPHSDWTHELLPGDVDGDGALDLFAVNSSQSSQNRLYRNLGGGVFVDATAGLPAVQDGSYAADIEDVDGDGDLDVLVGNAGPNRLLRNDGAGVFSDVSFLLPGFSQNTRAVLLGDVDGDGAPDAVIGNDDRNRFLRNDGSGAFVDSSQDIDDELAISAGIAGGDLDGDGDLDVFVTGRYGDPNRMYLNRTRQLAWRGLPRLGKVLNLDLYGTPGSLWILARADGVASIPLGPFGELKLDSGSLVVVSSGSLDALSGSATYSVFVPPVPALAGLTLHWQALLGSPPLLTNRERTTLSGL